MSMKDDIKIEMERGNIPHRFTSNHLLQLREMNGGIRIGSSVYKKSTIITNLNNFRVGPSATEKGAQVNIGRKPWFTKFSDKSFCLLESDEEETNSNQDASAKKNKTIDNAQNCIDRITSEMVNYIREKPFRILLNGRSKKWHPQEGAVIGWKKRLELYKWPSSKESPNWQETKETLDSFSDRAKELLKSEKPGWKDLYDDIKKWGNPRGADIKEDRLCELISHIQKSQGESCQEVNSTLTKLYAIAFPDKYAIFDSRVATAIISIAEDLYRGEDIDLFVKSYPNIGFIPSSSGTRPRPCRVAWPNAYTICEAQLEANRLISGLVSELNKNKEDGLNWNLRMVEAVLFMEGY